MNREKLEEWRKSLGARPNGSAPTVWDLYNILDALLEGGAPAPDVGPHAGMGVSTAELFGQRLEALEADVKLPGGVANWKWVVERVRALGTALNDAQAGLRNKHERLKWLEESLPERNQQSARLIALEAYRAGHDAYDLEVHGSLTALEGRIDSLARDVKALNVDLSALEATVPALEKVDAAEGETIRALEALRTEWAGMLGRIDAGETMQTRRLAAVAKKWRPMAPKLSIFADLFDALLGAPDVGHYKAGMGGNNDDVVDMRSGQPWAQLTPLTPVKRGATPCPVCGSTICMGDPKACDQRAAARTAKG